MPKTRLGSARSHSSRTRWLLLEALLCVLAVSCAQAAAARSAGPVPVTHSLSIRHGDWIPLPAEEMRRAAADPALARLTDAGRLEILSTEAAGKRSDEPGSLRLEIALIGPAETAKLTMTLEVPGSPTLVSTASITVHGLDHAGIHLAFEHVGQRAADRLVAKLDLLEEAEIANAPTTAKPKPLRERDDAARRQAYDAAQAAKRAGEYARARAAFEALVAATDAGDDPVGQLAVDELRYGLPLFEAQQSLNQLGRLSRPGQQAAREAALTRAENLFRQIQAENPSSIERVAAAQRSLDSLIVTRGALANAMRAQTMIHAGGIRVAFLQDVMIEGRCPDAARAAALVEDMRVPLMVKEVLEDPSIEGASGTPGRRYRLADRSRTTRLELICTQDHVEIVESPRAIGPAKRGSAMATGGSANQTPRRSTR